MIVSLQEISMDEAGEMIPWLAALVLAENLGLVPSARIVVHSHP